MRAVTDTATALPGADAALCAGAAYLPGEAGGTDCAMRGGSEGRPSLYARLSTCFSNLVVFYH